MLLKGGKIVAHDNSVAASYGLQADAQSFGYARFLMIGVQGSKITKLDKQGE